MSPDRCKVCGTVHRRRDPHVWGAESNSETNGSNRKSHDSNSALDGNSNGQMFEEMLRWRIEVDVEIATLKGVVMELQQRLTAIDTTSELVSKAFDKTAYQREYMRAKRAKA